MAISKTSPYFTTPPALVLRNKKIVTLVREGKKQCDVAELFGISAARVSQIVQRGK